MQRGAQGLQRAFESRTGLACAQMRTDQLGERPVVDIERGELTIREGIQMHSDVCAVGEGRGERVGREVLCHRYGHGACETAAAQADERSLGPGGRTALDSFGVALRPSALVIVTVDTLA